jgi:DNA-binding NtrC family response regulator
VDTSTLTGDASATEQAATGAAHAWLTFIAHADDLRERPASHSLADLDEVRFQRGPRSVERRGRVLVLAIPDPRMSSEHGRLVRHGDRWLLDDPSSKNGAVVDGTITRRAPLADGTVIELGRSFFVFRIGAVDAVPDHLAGDVEPAQLPAWGPGMATFSPTLAAAFAAVARIAATAVSIVIHGETGTGKEVIARAIHRLSRRPGELVAINCGALASALVEAELFGHRKGAFTGAAVDRPGLVRSADRGTLFLDEIGDLPRELQTAFLRVLQEHEVLPVGDDRPVRVDLRLISATLCDLESAVASGRFRADLHHRILGHTIELPRLRDRREDLGLLIDALLAPGTPGRTIRFAPAALRAIVRHDWPGNIRELQKVLAAAVELAPGGTIELEHLPAALRRTPALHAPAAQIAPTPAWVADLDREDRELRERLVALFEEHQGNVVAVAEALGKQRTQIYKWIKRLGIDVSQFRRGG